jgi:CO dehydrogenase maturation factor
MVDSMNATKKTKARVLAVAGKGGAGKTTFATIMIRLLVNAGQKLLAVDADPPISLTYALGAEPDRTVGEMRTRLIEDPGEKRRIGDRHMRDVIREDLVIRTGNVNLLVLGQAEGAGCFCGLNELLKHGIESLSGQYDVTVIDCEAGIEQINRRVINSIDTLFMVSDPTHKGLRTAVYLDGIARKHGILGQYRSGLIINRIDSGVDGLDQKAGELGLEVWGHVPMDRNVADYDRDGRPTIELPDNSSSVVAVREILVRLGIL